MIGDMDQWETFECNNEARNVAGLSKNKDFVMKIPEKLKKKVCLLRYLIYYYHFQIRGLFRSIISERPL